MSFINAPCCEDCWWLVDNENLPTAVGRGINEKDEVRWPVRIRQEYRDLEHCHFCGYTTFSGIYVRTDDQKKPAAEHKVREEVT